MIQPGHQLYHLGYDAYRENIGKQVSKCMKRKHKRLQMKKGNIKPFKSGEIINTVAGVIEHPILHVPAYIFVEDDSYVECMKCMVLE